MMLHRHFSEERPQNMTTLADVTQTDKGERAETATNLPDKTEEAPKRRGRSKKTD